MANSCIWVPLEMLWASALSAISFVTISLKRPAKICHHSKANIFLVLIFNDFNVLVKPLTVLIGDISIVFRKKNPSADAESASLVTFEHLFLDRHSTFC